MDEPCLNLAPRGVAPHREGWCKRGWKSVSTAVWLSTTLIWGARMRAQADGLVARHSGARVSARPSEILQLMGTSAVGVPATPPARALLNSG